MGSHHRSYHHGQLKQELLDLSEKALAENRFEQTSLRDLAKAAGVSHTAPYRHFESRQALETELLNREINCWLQTAQSLDTNPHLSDRDRLQDFGRFLVVTAQKSPAKLKMSLRPWMENEPTGLTQAKKEIFRIFLRWIVSELHRTGQRSSLAPVDLLKSIWAIYIGAALLGQSHWVPGTESHPDTEAAMKILDTGLSAIFKTSIQC